MGAELFIFGELAKVALISYFQYAQLAGMTQEQIDKKYQEEKTKFLEKDPEKIPT